MKIYINDAADIERKMEMFSESFQLGREMAEKMWGEQND
jgi:hypothetical protein